jgi:hypothetical protein
MLSFVPVMSTSFTPSIFQIISVTLLWILSLLQFSLLPFVQTLLSLSLAEIFITSLFHDFLSPIYVLAIISFLQSCKPV